VVSRAFVEEFCAPTIEAVRRIVDWVSTFS
jgi:hypothetical protein